MKTFRNLIILSNKKTDKKMCCTGIFYFEVEFSFQKWSLAFYASKYIIN